MRKFRVYFAYEAWAYAEVEAEDEEEAKSMVIYGDYDNPVICGGTENKIDDIEEITEEKE